MAERTLGLRARFDRRTLVLGAGALALPSRVEARSAAGIWFKLPTVPYRGKQDDIVFASASRGWYGNGEGRLYRTLDGGGRWEEIWHQPGTFVRALGFLNEQVGFLGNVGAGAFAGVTDRAALYRTDDGGMSWTAVRSIAGPMPDGICAIDVARFGTIDRGLRRDSITLHAAGRVGGPAHYLRSTDLGRSWVSTAMSDLTAAIFDVKFINPRTGFIAGSSDLDLARANGLILRTDDGGSTWRIFYRSARPAETVWKLAFPTTRVGYGTVQSYDQDPANTARFVAKSDDGGRSWHEVAVPPDHRWQSYGIGFASEKHGWVGGNMGGLETLDGGASWRPAELGKAVNKFRFLQADGLTKVFAIGSELHCLILD